MRVCLIFAMLFLFVAPLTAMAQQSPECQVHVKSVHGAKDAAKKNHLGRSVKMLSDIKGQLDELPYSSYDVLDVVQHKVKLGEEGIFKLKGLQGEKHIVAVSPRMLVNRRVKMEVHWTGPAGEELLSTQLRVVNGKNVVLGTDRDRDSSTIMSIKMECR